MTTANVVEGLLELGHEVYGDTPGCSTSPLEEIEYDLLIEFSNRSVNSSLTKYLSATQNLSPIYINGEDFLDDHAYNREWDCFRDPKNYKLYFRREMRPFYKKMANEYPLPFGVYPKYLEHYNPNKNGDFIFPSNGEYPNRREIMRYILENNLPVKLGRIGEFRHSITDHGTDDYFKYLNDASVIVSACGWGQDTARYWEGLATGACVISEKVDLVIPNPLTHMENIIYFEHPFELIEIFSDIKEGKIDIETIGRKGREYVLNNHMVKQRAEYILEKASQYNLIKRAILD